MTGAALMISACDSTLDIVDGKIPERYLTTAQTLVGNYTGDFAGQAVKLNAVLNADNQLIVTPSQDLVGADCSSVVGKLKQISYETNGNDPVEITHAVFEFDAGKCRVNIVGTQLEMEINNAVPGGGQVELAANILRYIDLTPCKVGEEEEVASKDSNPPRDHTGRPPVVRDPPTHGGRPIGGGHDHWHRGPIDRFPIDRCRGRTHEVYFTGLFKKD